MYVCIVTMSSVLGDPQEGPESDFGHAHHGLLQYLLVIHPQTYTSIPQQLTFAIRWSHLPALLSLPRCTLPWETPRPPSGV